MKSSTLKMNSIIEVVAHGNHTMSVVFNDGTNKTIDVNLFIKSYVTSALREINYFR
jgi:hypothetical protein